jgi:hypothetical protein
MSLRWKKNIGPFDVCSNVFHPRTLMCLFSSIPFPPVFPIHIATSLKKKRGARRSKQTCEYLCESELDT